MCYVMMRTRHGGAGYWSKNRNRFDGVITLGGVLTELVSGLSVPVHQLTERRTGSAAKQGRFAHA